MVSFIPFQVSGSGLIPAKDKHAISHETSLIISLYMSYYSHYPSLFPTDQYQTLYSLHFKVPAGQPGWWLCERGR